MAVTDVPPWYLDLMQSLGELRHQVGIVQAQNSHIIKEQDQAAERRQRMYEKLDKIEPMSQKLEGIAPLVVEHERAWQRQIGMAWLVRGSWTIGGGAVGAVAVKLLQYLTGSPPPQH